MVPESKTMNSLFQMEMLVIWWRVVSKHTGLNKLLGSKQKKQKKKKEKRKNKKQKIKNKNKKQKKNVFLLKTCKKLKQIETK